MSIAEKLIKIAENEPKVYEAGKVSEIQGIAPAEVDASLFNGKLKTIAENTIKVFEKGRADANFQKATASGEVVRVDDVSSIEHKLGITLSSDTITDFSGISVSRYGKNLALAEDVCKDFSQARLVTFEDRNTIRFIDNEEVRWADISFKENTQYTVSFDARITERESTVHRISNLMCFFYSDGTYSRVQSFRNDTWERFTLTSTAGKTVVGIGMTNYDFTSFIYIDCDSFQLEVGTTATDYEPYKEPQTALSSADGTVSGLTSLSPTMTIIPDTSGVTVTAEYYEDK